MITKNNLPLKLLFSLLFLDTLLATLALTAQVLHGYSGFEALNGRQQVISLDIKCPDPNLRTKYGP
jgi:hypothetical protein